MTHVPRATREETEQLEIALPVECKYGCGEEVVGHSTTGEGHVCRRHNVEEWGRSLARNRGPYYRRLGALLLADKEQCPTCGSDDPARRRAIDYEIGPAGDAGGIYCEGPFHESKAAA